MSEDLRCCGSGTCLINAAGVCWCGQQWDGENLCSPAREQHQPTEEAPSKPLTPLAQSATNKPHRSAANA